MFQCYKHSKEYCFQKFLLHFCHFHQIVTTFKRFFAKIAFMNSHEIDYKVIGHDIQLVEVELDPGETVIAEAGAMMYMEDGIRDQH